MSPTHSSTPVGASPRFSCTAPVQLSRADIENGDPEGGRGGLNRRWLCPLPACAGHQNPRLHRSLSLHEDGRWRCHRCGGAGLVTDAPRDSQAMRHQRILRSLSVASALPRVPTADDRARWQEKVGPVRRLDSPGSRAAREYLTRQRGFTESDLPLLDSAGVRFGPQFYRQRALLFSLRQRPGGDIVAVQGRLIVPRPDGPKMLTASAFEDGSHGGLFFTPDAIDPGAGRIVVTEAPLDAASLLVLGVPAIATCGARHFPPALRRACTLRHVVAAYDADDAGDEAAAALETIALSVGATFERLRPEGAKDWNAALRADRPALAAFLRERLPAPALESQEPAPPEPGGEITRPSIQTGQVGDSDAKRGFWETTWTERAVHKPSGQFANPMNVWTPHEHEPPWRIANPMRRGETPWLGESSERHPEPWSGLSTEPWWVPEWLRRCDPPPDWTEEDERNYRRCWWEAREGAAMAYPDGPIRGG